MHNHGLARGWFVIDEDKKMMVEEQQPDIPVTILTGFLGAGKTTLLNRILSENHNYKIAIVENEFGKENIDTDLLVQTDREQIVNMNNGCVCCTIRGDLSKVLTDLRLRRSRGEIKFDYVVIETSGVANPGPVAQTFFMDDAVAAFFRLDGVVTVVDCKHGSATLDEEAAARDQVGFADRILLSKTDLCTAEEVAAMEQRLRQMNARAADDADGRGLRVGEAEADGAEERDENAELGSSAEQQALRVRDQRAKVRHRADAHEDERGIQASLDADVEDVKQTAVRQDMTIAVIELAVMVEEL